MTSFNDRGIPMSKLPSPGLTLGTACAAVLQVGQAFAAAPGYTVTWLGFLNGGDTSSFARDINNSGQVVGSSGVLTSNGLNNRTRGFLWTPQAGLTDLGQFAVCATQPCYTTGADGSTWNDGVEPWAIGDAGHVAGTANGPGGYEHAFLYTDAAGMTAPLGLPTGRNDGAAGVNGLGDVVGHMTGTWTGTTWSEAGFIYRADGTLQTLPGLSGSDVMYAYDINDTGLIVGGASYRMPPDGVNPPGTITYGYRPVLWEKGQTGQYSARILPGFETAASWNFAYGVNASGQVVGYRQLPDNYHAFLYDNGTIADLGCGMAQSINAAGTVVGGETTIGGSAFIYIGGARYDLNALASNKAAADHIAYAQGINDSGWIAGWGTHNGKTEALVLIPDGSLSPAQPSASCPGATSSPPPSPPPSPQGADLALTLSGAPDPVTVGSKLTYTITVTNNGTETAGAVTVSDALPANTSFSSASTTQGSCTGTASITCNLGDLTPGATATITLVIKPLSAGELSNTASAGTSTQELNPADDSATAVTTVAAAGGSGGADLSVTLIDEPDPAVVGEPVDYVVELYNRSDIAASEVVLTVSLPAGVPLSEMEGASCTGTGTLTCNLGTVPADSDREIKFKLMPEAVGTVSGSVTVTSTTSDPNPANNTASAVTTIH